MLTQDLRSTDPVRFTHVIGIGGIGTGVIFALQGNHTLGREESRLGELMHARDYCKLHIVEHYIAAMMRTKAETSAFHVSAIGVIGEDPAGDRLLQEMKQAGINTKWVRRDATRSTLSSVCFTYPDGSGGNVTASNSAATMLDQQDILQAESLMKALKVQCVALCLPEVTLEIRHSFLKLATEARNFRVASIARGEIKAAQTRGMFSLIDLLAINVEEASQIVGYPYSADNRNQFLSDCSTALIAMQPQIAIVVSAGAEGAFVFENGAWNHCVAPKVTVVSTAGAGDALLAGIVWGQSIGLPLSYSRDSGTAPSGSQIHSAVELGLLLATFSVRSPHSINFDASPDTLAAFATSLVHPSEPSYV